MRKLDITRDAYKFLVDLQTKPFRQVTQKVLALLVDPQPNDAAQLRGHEYWRTDIGEYRIIYRFNDEAVYLVLVGKRNDDEIYRQFERL